MKFCHTWRRLVAAKATLYAKTDVEGRRLVSPKGLATPAVLADNAECHRLDYISSINESASIPPQE